jgi:hypothetical protein
MIGELWTLCALKIGATVIGQVVEQEAPDDIQDILGADSGEVYPRGSSIALEDPRFRVTTQAVKTALATVGLTGVALSAEAPAQLFFQKHAQGGTRTAAACHAIQLTAGVAFWSSLDADQNGAAVDLEVIGTTPDGTNAPQTVLDDQAIPTFAAPELYVAGGSAAGVQSIRIDTGIAPVALQGDGEAWNSIVSIDRIVPRVVVRQTKWVDLGPTTLASVALTDCAQGGYRGSSPITFTFNQIQAVARRVGGRPSLIEIEGLATYNGTNAPILITGLT